MRKPSIRLYGANIFFACLLIACSPNEEGFDGSNRLISSNLSADVVEEATGLELCAKASEFREETKQINFPARQDCSFGMNGNGPRVNTSIQAYESQTENVDIVDGGVLCGFELKSLNSGIRYDDFMYMTLNDRVIISSEQVLVDKLRKDSDDGLKVWDFQNIQFTSFDELDGQHWCLGDSDCRIPSTDRDGAFNVQFDFVEISAALDKIEVEDDSDDLRRAASFASGSILESMELGVHITGDNDDGDCSHTGLDLELKLKYLK